MIIAPKQKPTYMINRNTGIANTNFINLQDELAGTENRISTARRDYNDAVKSYNPVASLSNNLSAGGGSATLSAQCTRVWASGKTDTVGGTISKVEFITNGNSRFAVSTGNATDFSRVITHSSMRTTVTTDYVQVKVTFANSYTATSNTISVSNAVTSTTKPMLLGINWNKLISPDIRAL